jgi:hypothetical protein
MAWHTLISLQTMGKGSALKVRVESTCAKDRVSRFPSNQQTRTDGREIKRR